jgi:hypothetical protein
MADQRLAFVLVFGVGCFALTSCASGKAMIQDAQSIQFEGKRYRTIDNHGVYFTDPEEHGDVPLPDVAIDLTQRFGRALPGLPVRVRLVDAIDCTKKDHEFNDADRPEPFRPNPPSRLMEIGGKTFRVTASPMRDGFDCMHFWYMAKTKPEPGKAHLLVAESINDRERYTSIAITHPQDSSWAAPFQDEPLVSGDCQEPYCFHPDVGLETYTGREYKVDGKPFNIYMMFYPKTEKAKITVASEGWYLSKDENSGGAVSRFWIYEVLDPIPERRPEMEIRRDFPERKIGIYMTHPWFFYSHYGVPARTVEQRTMSLQHMVDHMKFCGFNWIEYNVINGSDRASVAWYPDSEFYEQLCGDLLSELSPVAEREDIGVLPVLTSIRAPKEPHQLPDSGDEGPYGFSKESFQLNAHGGYSLAFNNAQPDPLRPEVQAYLIRIMEEIASKAAPHRAIKGLGFRVSGKIGLCYTAHQGSDYGAKKSGYSDWDLAEFQKDTGIEVPKGDPGRAYNWLRERPDEWDKWIAFRCKRTREFWLRVRDAIRKYRPDWNLYVKTVLPSEVPGTNIEWVEQGFSPLDLIRHHGCDPRMFRQDEGIVIERTMMVDENRYFSRSRWLPPDGANHDAYKEFHFQPELATLYRGRLGNAVEIYHNYWEEHFHPDVQYGGPADGFRTHTATGPGRSYYETLTWSLKNGNVDLIALMGWERPTLGHEHDLREFSQAFRALPKVASRPFDGQVKPVNPKLWVRWFTDRLAVLNDSENPEEVTLTFKEPLPEGAKLVDVARGVQNVVVGDDNKIQVSLDLEPWSLRTLVIE